MTLYFPQDIQDADTLASIQNIHSPFTGECIATVETSTWETANLALEMANTLFLGRKFVEPEFRIQILEQAAIQLSNEQESFAHTIALEGGKPIKDAKIEVARAVEGLKECAACVRTNNGQTIPMNRDKASKHHLAVTIKEPIGVVVAFSAFNHPLNLLVHQIGPAIAAGCPIIIKPAESTPLSCIKLVQLLRLAGLPKNQCQIIHFEDKELATKLAIDERVGFFSFIGSAAVGWSLKSKLAPGTRCALEHGGLAPAIIATDISSAEESGAKLDNIVQMLIRGSFYHAGQVCVSVQRIYIPSDLITIFTEKLKAAAEKLDVGDPTLDSTDVGPLIRQSEIDRVHDWVTKAVEEGAELILGGSLEFQKNLKHKNCYPPTILLNPSKESLVSKKEIFGPVVCLYGYDNMDEAIKDANNTPFCFQASIFTQNIDTAMHALKHLKATAVMVNESTTFRVDWMPFSGGGLSGLGQGGIPMTFQEMQTEKLLVIRSQAI